VVKLITPNFKATWFLHHIGLQTATVSLTFLWHRLVL